MDIEHLCMCISTFTKVKIYQWATRSWTSWWEYFLIQTRLFVRRESLLEERLRQEEEMRRDNRRVQAISWGESSSAFTFVVCIWM